MTEPTQADLAEVIREAEKYEKHVECRISVVYWLLVAAVVCAAAAKGGWALGTGVAFAL